MAWSRRTRAVAWWLLLLASAVPLLWLLWNWALLVDQGLGFGYLAALGGHSLTVNPIEHTNRFLGDWSLRFLLLGLALTPAARILGANQLVAYRRMIGLWAFAYVCLHLTSYVVLDQFFDWSGIWQDIVKRNFITLGMLAFVLLLPMAITSTKGWIRRLGARSWKRIHQAVYLIAVLGAVHYMMMVKGNQLAPKVHLGIVALLLGTRIWMRWGWGMGRRPRGRRVPWRARSLRTG
jgi:sulfoxide reductase heme-binding subunit YedZ